MNIKVLGWGYENIRRIYTLDVDLLDTQGRLPHVSLIMMRNGTGKTTTIKLMRAVLSGCAMDWSSEEVRKYKPTEGNYVDGKFYLKVKFNEDIYQIVLLLDYENGIASYETTRTGVTGGVELEWKVPSLVKDVFRNEEFIRRFVFDGEQARMTLDSGKQEAENAITYLYQINKLDDMINEFNRISEKKKAESISQGLTKRSVMVHRTKVNNQEKILNQLIERSKSLEKAIHSKESELSKKEEQYRKLIESDENLKQRHAELQNEKIRCTEQMKNHFYEIQRIVKEPYQVHSIFHERLQNLLKHMQRLKLPKNIAKEFFNELAESPICICGTQIGEKEKSNILKNSEEYLGDEDLSVLNAIKNSIKNYQLDDAISEKIESLINTKEILKRCDMELEKLALELKGEKQETKERLDGEISGLKQAINRDTEEYKSLNAPMGTNGANETNNIIMAKKSWKEKSDNYEKVMGTFKFSNQINQIQIYISEIKTNALRRLKANILKKTNDKIEQIITSEHICIDKIDGSLKLKDRTGASEGQTLAIAYAYIGSLFEHSPFEFPFIVDSPAASMDLDVRREVATIIPKLFNQLIIFVTSGEVEGFVEKIYEIEDVLYYTIEGEEESSKLYEGKDFFASYQKAD